MNRGRLEFCRISIFIYFYFFLLQNSFQRLLQARDIILAKLSNSKYLAPVAAQLDSELRIKHALEPSTFSIDDRFDLPTVVISLFFLSFSRTIFCSSHFPVTDFNWTLMWGPHGVNKVIKVFHEIAHYKVCPVQTRISPFWLYRNFS